MKKTRPLLVFLTAVILLSACFMDSSNGGSGNKGGNVKTGRVTFFNESSYMVTVHLGAFSGPVLIESSGYGPSETIDVRTSDNYGIGSTFCVEYSFRVENGLDLASGEVWAKGIDPNIQINLVVEENKSYTVQIPKPTELEFPSAFIKILNKSSMQFELRKQGTAYKQAGNGNLPVPPWKIGVYEIPSTAAGIIHSGYSVHSTFNSVYVPEFTAKNSYIYDFNYDGSSVTLVSEEKIIF